MSTDHSAPLKAETDPDAIWSLGIKGRLMLSFSVVALITVLAGGFGMLSYGRIESAFTRVTDDSVPAMINAFQMVDQATALTSLASTIAAAPNPSAHAEARAVVASRREDMHGLVDRLAESTLPASDIKPLQALTDDLFDSLNDLERRVGARLELVAQRQLAIGEIGEAHRKLINWLTPKIDDANFDLVVQTEDATSSLGGQIETLMTDGVGRLQSALTLRAEVNLMAGILIEAVVAPNRGVLEAAADRFMAAKATVEENTALLNEHETLDALTDHVITLGALGDGPDGVFPQRRRIFDDVHSGSARSSNTDPTAWTSRIYRPREAILTALEPIVDEASFDLIILSESAVKDSSRTINGLIDQSVATLRSYLGTAADANWLAGLLRQASMEQDAAALEPIAEQIKAAKEHLLNYQRTLHASETAKTELNSLLQPLLARAIAPEAIVDLRAAEMDLGAKLKASVDRTHDLAAMVTQAVNNLVESARIEVMASSDFVQDAISRGRWLLASLSVASLLIAAIVVFFYVGPKLVRPLGAMSESVARLARGEQVDVPGIERADELGDLARALSVIHDRAIEATRIQLALDSADASVMVTDADQKIIYVNSRLNLMFRAAEDDIKRELSAFTTDGLLGSTIGVVHKDPEAIRDALEHLDDAHHESMNIGGRDLSFVANPVFGPDGNRLGSVMQWQDETDERKLRRAIDVVVDAAGAGDFTKRIDTIGMQGAIAELANGINHLVQLVEDATRDLGRMLAALAAGDLTRRITADYAGSLGNLKFSANATADRVSETVAQIKLATREVENAAAEINSGTEDLSRRTEQAASSLEETAASTEEMAATVKQNAKNARNASQLATTANQSAKSGGDVVEQAVCAMGRIEQSARKINEVIAVIDAIAFQTNLLALNASVEAARAGEAGKGFAVVAQEVRQLAQRSAQAAANIKTLIQASNGQVSDGVQLVNQAGGALAEIVGSISKVARIVQEISTASQEQAASVQEINSSIANIDEMTQQNSALVEQSSASARALSAQAGKLTQLMDFFKLGRASSAGDREQPMLVSRFRNA